MEEDEEQKEIKEREQKIEIIEVEIVLGFCLFVYIIIISAVIGMLKSFFFAHQIITLILLLGVPIIIVIIGIMYPDIQRFREKRQK